MTSYSFHVEAAEEYLEATKYYLSHASPLIAAAFVSKVEASIRILRASPTTWAVMDEPQIRRYLLTRFPYSLYYRWDPELDHVSIYAVMHFSRRAGYWRNRLTTP